jgi:hypothetical protein
MATVNNPNQTLTNKNTGTSQLAVKNMLMNLDIAKLLKDHIILCKLCDREVTVEKMRLHVGVHLLRALHHIEDSEFGVQVRQLTLVGLCGTDAIPDWRGSLQLVWP